MAIDARIVGALFISVAAAGGTTLIASERSEQTVIRSREFTIAKGQCPQLAAGVEVKGLGLERTTTVVASTDEGDKHEQDGEGLTYSLLSRIDGTATDNQGGTYRFTYQLRFKKPAALPGTAIAVDTFKLTGTGAADGMSTFFRARVTLDSGANPVAFEILEQSGNPFQCDPL
jgi:hypothetical protein